MALDYYEKRASAIREQWFPEHAPIFETQGNMQALIWAKSGTSIYKITYIIKANRLMVFGDVGDAIYEWSNLLTWEWLAGLDLGYFASKCCASEKGRQYREWDTKEAQKWLDGYFAEHSDDKPKFEELFNPDEDLASGEAWINWMANNGDEIFGSDCFELADIGYVHDMRCQSHLMGLKMAIERKITAAAA